MYVVLYDFQNEFYFVRKQHRNYHLHFTKEDMEAPAST